MSGATGRRGWYRAFGKRALDLAATSLGLVALAPVFLATAVAVKADSRGPVFFTQPRAGRDGVQFPILKFRSMRTFEDSYDADGNELSNSERVTRVGRVLRRTSLDELPQLLNVVAGHMSLVGPRPALPYQVERYSAEQAERLLVRPGMTGLAQVSGRNALSWDEKIELDVAYVRDLSLARDIAILVRTVRVVFSGAGLQFERHDRLSEHGGDLRRHIGEHKP